MEEFGRYLNVIDVEATCWETAPPIGQASEIIEIGLCVIDAFTFERVERHRLLVRPQRSTISAFCTQLTGLQAHDVDDGLTFRDVCLALERQHRASSRSWASWGDYDRKQFERQCRVERVPYPFSSRHTNVKTAFSKAFELNKKLGMHEALEHASLPLEGRHHRGDDDAWNIGSLVVLLFQHGAWPT
ncbi:3'-5' exonuclease [Deinococcus humi]|uniref:Inhibitor of KinA sporulation pathway (Predicted exonuclease) n=1 Tax=Deinococcus humi TaxID=662880 RepID=A0A7W8NGD5_9DEIO|nr:3'-5' exonuclease [Deinococcus humi]MBB5363658.1 inhibitor of KinA sporulation pathway (predicted exonuclease) [Deinococcus humi]GGO29888.1 DNA polymerase III [Deinococcus humi]